MPLIKNDPSKEAVSKNISQLMKDGYPQKQAVAIALRLKEKARKRKSEGVGFVPVSSLFEYVSFGSAPRGFDFSTIPIGDSHKLGMSPSSSTVTRPEDKNRDFKKIRTEPTGADTVKVKKRPSKRGRRKSTT